MTNQLSNYITNILNTKKSITFNDIANMCAIIAKNKHLEGYIKSFNLEETLANNERILTYDFPSKALVMHPVSLEDNVSIIGPNFKGFSHQEYALINILDILYRILLEFEKVEQWKIASSNDEKLEALIVRANLLHNIIFSNEKVIDFASIIPSSMYTLWEKYQSSISKKVPNFSPIDHLAQYYAMMEVLNVAKNMNEAKNIMYYLKIRLFQVLLDDYKKHIWGINAPTIEYFQAIGFLDLFNKQPFYAPSPAEMGDNIINSVSLDRRLKYALPISKREYSEIESRCV